MEADATQQKPIWQRVLPAAVGWITITVLTIFYFRSAYPDPSPFEYSIFRIVLGADAALAIGFALGPTLGLSASQSKISTASAAAIGVFMITYWLVPIGFEPIRVEPTLPETAHVNPPVADQKPPPREVVASYVFCTGEYERNCGFPHDIYQYCYFDPAQWGRANCKASTVNVITSHDGNKCGYTRYEVICRRDAP